MKIIYDFYLSNAYSYARVKKKNKKVKAHTSQRSQTAGTYPGFLNLKHAYENFYCPLRQR